MDVLVARHLPASTGDRGGATLGVSIQLAGDTLDGVRVLAPPARWMQETSPGVGQVEERDLRAELERIFRREKEADPRSAAESFLDDVRRESSLLLDQGGRKFGFIHLTFQEYLAAVALVDLAPLDVAPLIDALAPHVGDDQESSWHEVALLAIGLLSSRHEDAAGAALVELLARKPGEPGAAEVLAGRAVIDAGHRGVPTAVRKQVVDALLEALSRRRPRSGDTACRGGEGAGAARRSAPRSDDARRDGILPGAGGTVPHG